VAWRSGRLINSPCRMPGWLLWSACDGRSRREEGRVTVGCRGKMYMGSPIVRGIDGRAGAAGMWARRWGCSVRSELRLLCAVRGVRTRGKALVHGRMKQVLGADAAEQLGPH